MPNPPASTSGTASALLLQAVTVFVGIVTLAFMLLEPQTEGVNANATLFQIYFHDPFLAYVYIGSIPFFVSLYQVFMLLRFIRQNRLFSDDALRVLRRMKYAGIVLLLFVTGAEIYILLFQWSQEEGNGGVAVGLFGILIAVVIAAVGDVFGWVVKGAMAGQLGYEL